jgi:hypothetical protein
MPEITDERTIALATAKVERGADRIERVYGWEVERILAGLRAALAVACSIVGLMVATVFGAVGQAGLWQILVALAALGCSFGVTAYHYARLRRLYGNYLEPPPLRGGRTNGGDRLMDPHHVRPAPALGHLVLHVAPRRRRRLSIPHAIEAQSDHGGRGSRAFHRRRRR